ncbi:hypothetical protein K449DRAFT_469069 [Hypoxylon sp. EC38]|nr:hypothetical protein K449DRAFT_469069 [Hypoxylon sp. EC38]
MPYYYDNHHWNNHDLTRQLAHRLSRESRYTGHPTQYIVNEGRMTVDNKVLRHSNAVIYNAPGPPPTTSQIHPGLLRFILVAAVMSGERYTLGATAMTATQCG